MDFSECYITFQSDPPGGVFLSIFVVFQYFTARINWLEIDGLLHLALSCAIVLNIFFSELIAGPTQRQSAHPV